MQHSGADEPDRRPTRRESLVAAGLADPAQAGSAASRGAKLRAAGIAARLSPGGKQSAQRRRREGVRDCSRMAVTAQPARGAARKPGGAKHWHATLSLQPQSQSQRWQHTDTGRAPVMMVPSCCAANSTTAPRRDGRGTAAVTPPGACCATRSGRACRPSRRSGWSRPWPERKGHPGSPPRRATRPC